ncbi:DNA-directed RNA polymerase subunit D [Candidatus Woesearchaeota archaeon CG10_big_fil_rev_8_21_14_0_10_36_11]|nr:MAG: DNA-directed RNA polymerase subunit D [Candidatus Woesearchaeota archaeon CG10_big_fil_rev_8_21_14_0_10_36_11]
MDVEQRADDEEDEYKIKKMAIKLQKIREERKNNKLLFRIDGASEAFANTIRRLIIEEVPTLAVEDVEIKENDSALYDEMLALRLGLTPIKTDLKSYRLPESEDEVTEKSARCTLQLRLKAAKKGYVCAEEAESGDPKCIFVYPKMPIVKLLSKQKLDVTMTAVMGQGKDHIKWAPGWAFYMKEPVLKVGAVKYPQNIMNLCTDNVFTLKNNKLQVNQDMVYQSHLLTYYAEIDENIIVEYTDNIIFTLESWGQLSCKEILQKSAEILIDKVTELEQHI